MMTSHQALAVLLLGSLAFTASGREFLGAKHMVNSASFHTELNGVLAEVLGHGHGVVDTRLSKIHKTMDPLFRSLPKSNQGTLSVPVMRYAVRRYFSQNHGWVVKGFTAHEEAMNISSAVGDDILQSKLPGYIRSVLEDRFAHQGFSLDAVVAMVAAVERLAFDEVVRGVELAFHFNDVDRSRKIGHNHLKEVLYSYFMVEMLEGTQDKKTHLKDKKLMHRRYPHWDTTVLFLMDTVGSDIFQHQASSNPFVEQEHSFEDAVRMAEHISENFGSWSNHECHDMKDMLMEMDLLNTGRVKLGDFYRYSKDGAWQFTEPSEQLRYAGALDESSTWLGPQVMIPNYINSLSNCITSAPYYSICCLNECDQVFQQLEVHVAASHATASEIVSALESGTYKANVSTLNRERLDTIAHAHGEKIPIYGQLFARWLHFAYPQECPYPHAAGVVTPMNQQQWKELVGADLEDATEEEIAQHAESEFAHRAPSADAGATMWSLDEALLESSTPSDSTPLSLVLLRSTAQVGIFVGFLSVLLKSVEKLLRSNVKAKPLEYDV